MLSSEMRWTVFNYLIFFNVEKFGGIAEMLYFCSVKQLKTVEL